jgi:hypothetical protein
LTTSASPTLTLAQVSTFSTNPILTTCFPNIRLDVILPSHWSDEWPLAKRFFGSKLCIQLLSPPQLLSFYCPTILSDLCKLSSQKGCSIALYRLIADFLLHRPGFNPSFILAKYMMNRVTLEGLSLNTSVFLCQLSFRHRSILIHHQGLVQ